MQLTRQGQLLSFLISCRTRRWLPRLCLALRLYRLQVIRRLLRKTTICFIGHKALHWHHKRGFFSDLRYCARLNGSAFVGVSPLHRFGVHRLVVLVLWLSNLHRTFFDVEGVRLSRTHNSRSVVMELPLFFLGWRLFNQRDSHFFNGLP